MMATAAATRGTKICGQSNIVQGVLRTRDGHTNIGRRGGGGMWKFRNFESAQDNRGGVYMMFLFLRGIRPD